MPSLGLMRHNSVNPKHLEPFPDPGQNRLEKFMEDQTWIQELDETLGSNKAGIDIIELDEPVINTQANEEYPPMSKHARRPRTSKKENCRKRKPDSINVCTADQDNPNETDYRWEYLALTDPKIKKNKPLNLSFFCHRATQVIPEKDKSKPLDRLNSDELADIAGEIPRDEFDKMLDRLYK